MKISKLLTAIFAVSCLCLSCGKGSSFFKVEDGSFVRKDVPSGNEAPFYYIGTNFWYGAILGSESTGGGNRTRLLSELDTLKSLGIDNLRILVGGDGDEAVPNRIEPSLQKAPGVYDEKMFEGLDFLLAEMGKRNMTAVLYLNNAWEWSGGYGMYLEWAGHGKAPIPAETGYAAYTQAVSKFITDDKAKAMFADHVEKVVSRTNTVTGKAYKDDPAIFSWQICNEPRCFSADEAVRTAFVDWLWRTAAQIKSIDPNHMVSTGSEGMWGCEGSMELFERVHSCPDIDYMTIHIWPYNWSWVNAESLEEDLPSAIEKTDEYIDMHLEVARKYGKPVVIEEFGFPRDGFAFSKSSPTTARDRYYSHIFDRVVDSSKEKGLLAGVNFWGWGGFAAQSEDNIYWKRGDDYCGDPAQEQQGLNSVYASDMSTTDIVKAAANSLK